MKKWYQSKTIWANIIAGLLSLIALFDATTLALLGIENTTKYLGILGLITTVVNLILRAITNKGIGNENSGTDIGGGTVGTPR